ncbi:MAG: CHY zinc finger protein [Leuconostoc mesenteroides]|uniref:CHY zinc finger protein n=1 Tax=Leuconostoc mesenteroides TaxID=1245 RepID=UPI0023610859|nr:CHY zinc finger protein [Leuconostoc mesenteroides]
MIKGINLDQQGRCKHWHTDVDVVANRCAKCRKYYACYLCHDALNTHPFVPVSLDTEETAVCCGVCLHQMTPAQYLMVDCKIKPNT